MDVSALLGLTALACLAAGLFALTVRGLLSIRQFAAFLLGAVASVAVIASMRGAPHV